MQIFVPFETFFVSAHFWFYMEHFLFHYIWNIFCSWFHATKKKNNNNNNKASFRTFEHSSRSTNQNLAVRFIQKLFVIFSANFSDFLFWFRRSAQIGSFSHEPASSQNSGNLWYNPLEDLLHKRHLDRQIKRYNLRLEADFDPPLFCFWLP